MTDSDVFESVVDRVAELLRHRIGLRTDLTLRGRLRRAIRDEAVRRNESFTRYVSVLLEDADALQHLMNRVTVQETAFFRHPEHFDVVSRELLPTLPRPIRIWSAACANGQEAYSLAMLLDEHGIEGNIIASDLSTAALARTDAARYTSREISGLSPERISRHLTRVGDGWEINKSIRDRVDTMHLNLVNPLPVAVQSSQVVFCRNVLIYLSSEDAHTFLDRIADSFTPSVTLFLGAAETIWPFSSRFKAVPVCGTFVYRQPDPSTARARRDSAIDATTHKRAWHKSSTRRHAERHDARTRSPRHVHTSPSAAQPSTAELESAELATALVNAGQDAVAVGDYDAAVIAFRKFAYLAPHDPVAQLHLGFALEAAGDDRSAQRAYAAARRALLAASTAETGAEVEGYSTAEVLSLLESKQKA